LSAWYLDSSAFVKLVWREEHSDALRSWRATRIADGDSLVGCDLLRTEAVRAVRHEGDDTTIAVVRSLLESDDLTLLRLAPEDYDEAGSVDPPGLRSLDALHLVAASKLGPDLAGVVTYDRRLAAAASAAGFPVVGPE
jgi:predicted nucleic acid-binding protein